MMNQMRVQDFTKVLESIDIEVPEDFTTAMKIGEELDMDSQEIVELLCELETATNLKLADGFILRTDTVEEALDRLNHLLKQQSPVTSNYAFTRTDQIMIHTSRDTMIEAIWNLYAWEEKLAHIKKIDVLYDDGRNQEFLMTVQTSDVPVKVRSIRRLNDDQSIAFFQPEPPVYLRHHAGLWTFTEVQGNVLIELEHRWNVKEESFATLFPGLSETEAAEQINLDLQAHALATLNLWKGILEGVKA